MSSFCHCHSSTSIHHYGARRTTNSPQHSHLLCTRICASRTQGPRWNRHERGMTDQITASVPAAPGSSLKSWRNGCRTLPRLRGRGRPRYTGKPGELRSLDSRGRPSPTESILVLDGHARTLHNATPSPLVGRATLQFSKNQYICRPVPSITAVSNY